MHRQPRVDLHCHSRASDGDLTPAAVVERAAGRGVDVLALTDHDTVAGVAEAAAAAAGHAVTLIPGAELSLAHREATLHVLALGVDPNAPGLARLLEQLQDARRLRARHMAERLERLRLAGAWERLQALAGDAVPTRVHVADLLVEADYSRDRRRAFRDYLRPGRPAYAEAPWSSLEDGIAAVRAAGGVAVLAHPGVYGLSARALGRVVDAFAAAGGEALEVVTGPRRDPITARAASHARRRGLLGSAGSDFHRPLERGPELGALAALPPDIPPVWERWLAAG